MLVHAFPWKLLAVNMPLEHLPEYHCAREDVHLVVVFRMRVPELGRLPVDSPNQAADHRTSRLLDFRETKVGDLRHAFGCDEDVRGLAIAVDNGGFAGV